MLFVDSKGKPLKEQIELRGFSPLAARYEVTTTVFHCHYHHYCHRSIYEYIPFPSSLTLFVSLFTITFYHRQIFFSGIDPLTKQLPVIPDEPSRDRRLRTIRLLIREWPTPVVVPADTVASDGNKLLGHISGAGILKVSADVMHAMSRGGHDKSDHNHSHQRDRENQKKNKKSRRDRER